MIGANYPNDSTSTVGIPSQAKIGYMISQDTGKEKEHKSFLPHILKITLFAILIWACPFSSEGDVQSELLHANISGSVAKAPFPQCRSTSVLKNKPEPTAEEMLERLRKNHCMKSKIQGKDKDKRLQRMLSAIPKVNESVDTLHEEVQYNLLKCNCEEGNVDMDDLLQKHYVHRGKKSKCVFIKDLIVLATVGMVIGAIVFAAMQIWGAVLLLIMIIPVGSKIIDILNER
ncbi:Plasmodium exported protein, unknown function [Plasmodium knowlesi strain H]|uniref:Uncharacterized protein n=3 Tax=Plasmodium knowlesi TaxID=5850 RepID=A0A5K1U0R5_PLAKH|nr:Plasmodium exported protein, unknown function [Plasmodium knowlesi strain H]OTN68740.1 Uncharacterized protein PKNOH_S01026400 [Plasmodium knowlesi]CAA9986259.1 Plasmodium exported protein, unknown function [Plasmodium knowlesi strain H]SBO25470.1 Plasmodium exported protein, unknown function [Plasmodium knowlesi strain H]SBO27748.1 Plasmodium exported protein, unknown function [Plasmodium knowlesi strain H]VVS75733.1 Plasmodium exported protein, unknown function [Plasmodium knowlesi strain|eukprot:XP_002257668.1 hypothetical protein, conserved in Plasmodium species [Plasmodium knowlesi strain H]